MPELAPRPNNASITADGRKPSIEYERWLAELERKIRELETRIYALENP